ncbi:MAG TPA: hypothetical protein VG838_03910 [Opitutaceae bacterium]|nr:hypothetical protein [Opitutaceae bacterium]
MKTSRKIALFLFPPALMVLVLAARRAAGPPEERWGVMTHFAQGWSPDLIPAIAHGGIPTVRDELYWAKVEPKPHVYSFPPAYDAYMAALRRNHIEPLVVLSFENGNYDGGDTPHTPEARAAYARYAVEVLRHYGSQIKAVEIWNEYNGSFSKGPATEDRAASYLALLRAAYAAIKRERPDVIVVGGATSGVPLPYWEKLLAGGALDSLDVLSVHPYRYDEPPEGLEAQIAGLQRLVLAHNSGVARPVWVTEIGWYTKPSRAPGDLAIDERTQAEFLARAYALLLSARVQRVYWYAFQDENDLTMGLVRNDGPHTAKPAYTALATLAEQLRHARFVGRDDTPEDLYSLRFERPSGEAVRVVWSLQPRPVTLTGAKAAVDLEGRAVPPNGTITLNDSPLFFSGPLAGLPRAPSAAEAAESAVLADSSRDFAGPPDTGAWSYGEFVGDSTTFAPLAAVAESDWKKSWSGEYPYLSITAGDQHPSVAGDGAPVAAVRRWRSGYDGTVRVAGSFRCGLQGDGVGVSIVVDGQRRFRTLIGGGADRPVVESFDFTMPARAGTTIDFAVDPGPAANLDFDATTVAAVIRKEQP